MNFLTSRKQKKMVAANLYTQESSVDCFIQIWWNWIVIVYSNFIAAVSFSSISVKFPTLGNADQDWHGDTVHRERVASIFSHPGILAGSSFVVAASSLRIVWTCVLIELTPSPTRGWAVASVLLMLSWKPNTYKVTFCLIFTSFAFLQEKNMLKMAVNLLHENLR